MKRYLFIIVAVLVSISLIGCSEDKVEEKEVDHVDLEHQEEVDTEKEDGETQESTEDEDVKEIDEEVVNNDMIAVSLISVKKIINKDWDEEKYEIKFEVENKTDDLIEIQAREVSSDGKMIDESMLMMSQQVSGGKSADAVLTIENFDGDLPEIDDNLEMKLQIIDGETFMDIDSIDVNIDF